MAGGTIIGRIVQIRNWQPNLGNSHDLHTFLMCVNHACSTILCQTWPVFLIILNSYKNLDFCNPLFYKVKINLIKQGGKMDKNSYDEIISKLSKKLAKEIIKNEKQLDKRALLLDADIAEITRKIGLETVQQIYESILEKHVALKKKKKN